MHTFVSQQRNLHFGRVGYKFSFLCELTFLPTPIVYYRVPQVASGHDGLVVVVVASFI